MHETAAFGVGFVAMQTGRNRAPSRRRFTLMMMASALFAFVATGARAAELDGVQIPDTVQAGGKVLHLNGFGLRTYSVLRFHIYIAALYLEHPSANPEAILSSSQTKLLTVNFLHDVSADRERKAWQMGFAKNCLPPSCRLDPVEVATFLDHVPDARAGDRFSLLFDTHGASVNMDGQPLGVVSHREFAEVMLATFLGPNPGSHRLKRELLEGQAAQAHQ
jgi:hypothetical protein